MITKSANQFLRNRITGGLLQKAKPVIRKTYGKPELVTPASDALKAVVKAAPG